MINIRNINTQRKVFRIAALGAGIYAIPFIRVEIASVFDAQIAGPVTPIFILGALTIYYTVQQLRNKI